MAGQLTQRDERCRMRHHDRMATTLHRDLRYDGRPEAVAAVLRDRAFREEVLRRQQVLRGSVEEGPDGRLDIEQVHSTRTLPGFAQRLVGEEIVLRQTERWDGGRRADVEVVVPGKPVEVRGRSVLSPAGDATRRTVDLTVRVSVPLVGGKVEGLVRDMVGAALDVERQTAQEWLSDG
jgi:hypothetical protein